VDVVIVLQQAIHKGHKVANVTSLYIVTLSLIWETIGKSYDNLTLRDPVPILWNFLWDIEEPTY